MLIKNIIEEDFVNYKLPSMFIGTAKCNWKCATEGGFDISLCQNSSLASQPNINIPDNKIYERYIENSLTSAIVIGGLEPILQFNEVLALIQFFRQHDCNDDFVIYTGYYKDEIKDKINLLIPCGNIVMKYGRFIPNSKHRFDEVLGVTLISQNQYSERIC